MKVASDCFTSKDVSNMINGILIVPFIYIIAGGSYLSCTHHRIYPIPSFFPTLLPPIKNPGRCRSGFLRCVLCLCLRFGEKDGKCGLVGIAAQPKGGAQVALHRTRGIHQAVVHRKNKYASGYYGVWYRTHSVRFRTTHLKSSPLQTRKSWFFIFGTIINTTFRK